ncbi:hypothetical protein BLNAU_9453 [Blattamonas nauphoetae]|uniref:Uncharacterized protein n=1 Tax=Blattamonas nauphoetae TaxID=2049346 RepID=A0ABQ9XVS8_9EUKA|nr:hypothetical protein BLNAU_9453 [Blattamonas nauphoetae]
MMAALTNKGYIDQYEILVSVAPPPSNKAQPLTSAFFKQRYEHYGIQHAGTIKTEPANSLTTSSNGILSGASNNLQGLQSISASSIMNTLAVLTQYQRIFLLPLDAFDNNTGGTVETELRIKKLKCIAIPLCTSVEMKHISTMTPDTDLKENTLHWIQRHTSVAFCHSLNRIVVGTHCGCLEQFHVPEWMRFVLWFGDMDDQTQYPPIVPNSEHPETIILHQLLPFYQVLTHQSLYITLPWHLCSITTQQLDAEASPQKVLSPITTLLFANRSSKTSAIKIDPPIPLLAEPNIPLPQTASDSKVETPSLQNMLGSADTANLYYILPSQKSRTTVAVNPSNVVVLAMTENGTINGWDSDGTSCFFNLHSPLPPNTEEPTSSPSTSPVPIHSLCYSPLSLSLFITYTLTKPFFYKQQCLSLSQTPSTAVPSYILYSPTSLLRLNYSLNPSGHYYTIDTIKALEKAQENDTSQLAIQNHQETNLPLDIPYPNSNIRSFSYPQPISQFSLPRLVAQSPLCSAVVVCGRKGVGLLLIARPPSTPPPHTNKLFPHGVSSDLSQWMTFTYMKEEKISIATFLNENSFVVVSELEGQWFLRLFCTAIVFQSFQQFLVDQSSQSKLATVPECVQFTKEVETVKVPLPQAVSSIDACSDGIHFVLRSESGLTQTYELRNQHNPHTNEFFGYSLHSMFHNPTLPNPNKFRDCVLGEWDSKKDLHKQDLNRLLASSQQAQFVPSPVKSSISTTTEDSEGQRLTQLERAARSHCHIPIVKTIPLDPSYTPTKRLQQDVQTPQKSGQPPQPVTHSLVTEYSLHPHLFVICRVDGSVSLFDALIQKEFLLSHFSSTVVAHRRWIWVIEPGATGALFRTDEGGTRCLLNGVTESLVSGRGTFGIGGINESGELIGFDCASSVEQEESMKGHLSVRSRLVVWKKVLSDLMTESLLLFGQDEDGKESLPKRLENATDHCSELSAESGIDHLEIRERLIVRLTQYLNRKAIRVSPTDIPLPSPTRSPTTSSPHNSLNSIASNAFSGIRVGVSTEHTRTEQLHPSQSAGVVVRKQATPQALFSFLCSYDDWDAAIVSAIRMVAPSKWASFFAALSSFLSQHHLLSPLTCISPSSLIPTHSSLKIPENDPFYDEFSLHTIHEIGVALNGVDALIVSLLQKRDLSTTMNTIRIFEELNGFTKAAILSTSLIIAGIGWNHKKVVEGCTAFVERGCGIELALKTERTPDLEERTENVWKLTKELSEGKFPHIDDSAEDQRKEEEKLTFVGANAQFMILNMLEWISTSSTSLPSTFLLLSEPFAESALHYSQKIGWELPSLKKP